MANILGGIPINKEEILSKSRKENKDRDLFKIEVQVSAGNIGSFAATLLATLFFVTQSVIGDGFDFGLYAIILSISAAGFIFKAIRLKRRRDIVLSIIYTLATLILSVVHIYKLIATYTDIG
ncbi:DUF6442 family protein [Paenibacillus radicis (ex Gao et al. 2016)]|uniref:Uncharacterized protein n=1 Tax=Paenibacillus radicis (ex Gao et al. 2016) TaxID=1737354 RepID=A0A917H6N1_9BACL|nr:DUF6442 family protein [Paenibacillus radicis (ex Gao et al. 2016)]GGG69500.1 hypothetical protein GCM10010918_25860 [Paenibacillus radicis (ex Gao et al. 2016)]